MTDWTPSDHEAKGTIEVKKVSYWQPLASGICEYCGLLMFYNLAIGFTRHADEAVTDHEPWPTA